MKVKIDTKEKFDVITVEEEHISANMTEKLGELLLSHLNAEINNLVINLSKVKKIDKAPAEKLCTVQQVFYDNNCSLVICELQPEVEKFLIENDLLEMMNVTPTESEAWDIVQLEEIERELLD